MTPPRTFFSCRFWFPQEARCTLPFRYPLHVHLLPRSSSLLCPASDDHTLQHDTKTPTFLSALCLSAKSASCLSLHQICIALEFYQHRCVSVSARNMIPIIISTMMLSFRTFRAPALPSLVQSLCPVRSITSWTLELKPSFGISGARIL